MMGMPVSKLSKALVLAAHHAVTVPPRNGHDDGGDFTNRATKISSANLLSTYFYC
jgi:hypothetical protein